MESKNVKDFRHDKLYNLDYFEKEIRKLGFCADVDYYEAIHGEVIEYDNLLANDYNLCITLTARGYSLYDSCMYLYEVGKMNKC